MLTAPASQLRALGSDMQKLARGDIFLRPMAVAVRGLLKQEFASGEGPDGTWAPTVRGKQALLSKKLPQAFTTKIEGHHLTVSGRVARDWLKAHQEGRTFASRQAGGQALRFNAKGRLVNAKRYQKLKRGHATLSRAHTVGKRVLPARPIVPDGSMPAKWTDALEHGATQAMQGWYEKAVP